MEMKFSKLSILENSKKQKKKTIFNKFLNFFFTFFQTRKKIETVNV